MIDIWRPITRFEGYYEVSDTGKVRALDRTLFRKGNNLGALKARSAHTCKYPCKELKPIKSYGSLSVHLYKRSEDGTIIRSSQSLSKTVWRAFYPGYTVPKRIKHLNGNNLDCRVFNLEPPKGADPYEHIVPIPEYPGYFVSDLGRVFSNKQGTMKELSQATNPDGYLKVGLTTSEGRKTVFVHRLVIKAFSDEPEKETVDHIDMNKTNNRISNLRYADRSEQQKYLSDSGKRTIQSVSVRCNETGVVYTSMSQAEKVLGLPKKSVIRSMNNNVPVAGYTFTEVRRFVRRKNKKLIEV